MLNRRLNIVDVKFLYGMLISNIVITTVCTSMSKLLNYSSGTRDPGLAQCAVKVVSTQV